MTRLDLPSQCTEGAALLSGVWADALSFREWTLNTEVAAHLQPLSPDFNTL